MGKSRNQPLSDWESRYLRYGATGNYSETQMRDRIKSKQNNIGYRLNQLVRDLSLMYRSDHFDFNTQKSDILEDISIYKTNNYAFDNRIIAEPINNILNLEPSGVRLDQPTSGEEFGYYIGGLLHMILALLPEAHSWDRTLRGLMMFYLFIPEGNPEHRLNQLKELTDFEYIGKLFGDCTAKDVSEEYIYKVEFGYSKYNDNTKEIEFLLENDIPPSKVLCDRLRSPVDDENFLDYPSTRELFEKNLSECQSEPSFEKSIKLNKAIVSDIEHLKQPFRGPERLAILEQIRTGTQLNNAYNIAKGINKPSQDNLVETALIKMSDGVDEDERWTMSPVVEETNEQWKFTPYGELLAAYANNDITNEEFARHGLSEKANQYEMISAALAQTRNED